MHTRERIEGCLNTVGILIDPTSDDVNLNDYDVDSISFISFIVEVEKEFDIEIPDGYLYVEILQSLNGFVNLVEQLVDMRNISSVTSVF